MPLVCPLCGKVTAAGNAQLMVHMRLLHEGDPNFIIQRNHQECKQTFCTFTVYKNHIYIFHDTTKEDTIKNVTTETSNHLKEDPSFTDDKFGKFVIIFWRTSCPSRYTRVCMRLIQNMFQIIKLTKVHVSVNTRSAIKFLTWSWNQLCPERICFFK